MRSNSGKDEARDNLHDPTLRNRELGRGDTGTTEKGTESSGRSSDRPEGLTLSESGNNPRRGRARR